jgi:5-dehydro-2-deoxygluconokinase
LITRNGGTPTSNPWTPEVAVFGRISYDLNPLESQTRLEDVRTFERSVGGFAGNVATGLARLGIPTLIVSAVGDDPHGRYVRTWLRQEGVDDAALVVHPELRTALAFYESWPPDNFPITLFRAPTAPDWEIDVADLPIERITRAKGLLASGTALARPTSRATTLAVLAERASNPAPGRLTIVDLDWRPQAWTDPRSFASHAANLIAGADVVVGSSAEFEAARLSPDAVAEEAGRLVVVKLGPDGARSIRGADRRVVRGLPVPVTLGLGAGDGFIAALTAALFEGRSDEEALVRANAAGAIVASRPMCSPAMPTSAEIAALLAEYAVALAPGGRASE